MVDGLLRSSGRPLEPPVRASLEQRWGHDFSEVAIHTGEAAAAAARSVSARAFTVGRHIVFGAGRFAPQTGEGRRLLAHELLHTIQQHGAPEPRGRTIPLASGDDAAEREAEVFGGAVEAATASERPASPTGSAMMLRRQPEPDESSPSCGVTVSRPAPDATELQRRLVEFGVLQANGRSTDFSNVLYRHVAAGTRIGREYLDTLRQGAYPMHDFCIAYGGRGWNLTFRDVLGHYGYTRPTHRDLRLVERGVLAHDRTNLAIWVAAPPLPPPLLTPADLARQPRGAALGGMPPEGAFLLKATDAYLSTLSVSAADVSGASEPPVTAGPDTGSDVFAWADAATEQTRGDPNRFDAEIVRWTNHFNEIFRPLGRRGDPNPLDPDLVKAMVFVESRFLETASPQGSSAQGLLQVLRRERGLAGDLPAGVSGVTDAAIEDPAVQIATGIRILFEKYRRSRDWPTAVRDYNGSARRDAYREHVMRVYRSHRRAEPEIPTD